MEVPGETSDSPLSTNNHDTEMNADLTNIREKINMDTLHATLTETKPDTSNVDFNKHLEIATTILNDPEKVSTIVKELSQNPNKLGQVAGDAMQYVPPEVLNKAKKMAMGSEGKNVKNMMQKQSITHAQVRQAQEDMRIMNRQRHPHKPGEKSLKGILVTTSRQIKEKTIYLSTKDVDIAKEIKGGDLQCLKIPLLSINVWKEKDIYVYFTSISNCPNRRINKILPGKLGGNILIFCETHDLTMGDFVKVENELLKSIS